MADGKTRGLGRGLSALLGEYEPVEIKSANGGAARDGGVIALDLIDPNPDQPRRRFAEEELDDLAASIRAQGVLQPILVRPSPGRPGRYEIVAGERRWRAAQRAGLQAIPAMTRALSDVQVLEIAVIENVQREDLNPIEEARSYQNLIDRFGRTQQSIAEVVGKSRAHVANLIRLLTLPDSVQNMVRDGRLTAGHARAALAAPSPEALAAEIVAKGLSVREAERRAAAAVAPKRGFAPSAPDADTAALQADLAAALGLPVQVRVDGDRGGEVRLQWRSFDQLDEICRRLTRFG